MISKGDLVFRPTTSINRKNRFLGLSTRFFRIDSWLSIIRRNRFSVSIRRLDSTRPGADSRHDWLPASLPRLLAACLPAGAFGALEPHRPLFWDGDVYRFGLGHRSILAPFIESLLCSFTSWAILSPPVKSTKPIAPPEVNTTTLPYNWDEILSGEKAMWTCVVSKWSL